MIDLQQINACFPADVQENPLFRKHILKEYVQLLIMDFLSSSAYHRK